ncbi:MAG: Rrf2 family transcriptional regulator [Alphaproteobacteria bacterium]|nr:MAG: Rrf2 family transcriptional regulator [Alphaproteobacteria bacterium]
MFRFSKKMIFALEAVVDIAYNGRIEPVQSKEITRRQGIPQRYLEQVMQQLVRAGILRGVRGPRGGYFLARERRRITVAEILNVVASLESGADSNVYESKSDLGQKVVKPLIEEINREIMEKLEGITVEDLCTEASSSGIQSEAARKLDFTI